MTADPKPDPAAGGCPILRIALIAAATLVGIAMAQAEGLRLDAQEPPATPKTGREALEKEPPDASGYARICEGFGEGFTYSPSTGACIKISGYAKFGTSFGTRQSGPRSGTETFQIR